MLLFTTSMRLHKFYANEYIYSIVMDMINMFHRYNENKTLFNIKYRIDFGLIINHMEIYTAHTYLIYKWTLIIIPYQKI